MASGLSQDDTLTLLELVGGKGQVTGVATRLRSTCTSLRECRALHLGHIRDRWSSQGQAYTDAAPESELLLILDVHDPALRGDALASACCRGLLACVTAFLADPGIDRTARDNAAIRTASENGRLDVVRSLLSDPRVDPAADCNHAIRYASKNGHKDTVKVLMADPRVDPLEGDMSALNEALRHGHEAVVLHLLSAPHVDLSDGWIFDRVIDYGFLDVVRMLLADPRVDPSQNDNQAIQFASMAGASSSVRLLLDDPRVDPSANNNFAIRTSSEISSEIVRMLLDDPRVDPSAENNQAIRKASGNGRNDIVRLLLADHRVRTSALSDPMYAAWRGMADTNEHWNDEY